jgi:hypothetical protein
VIDFAELSVHLHQLRREEGAVAVAADE